MSGSGAGVASRAGVPRVLLGFGQVGKGQVISLTLSGQNGLMWSYRYHCRSADRPLGETTDGSSSLSGTHGVEDLFKSILTSAVSACS